MRKVPFNNYMKAALLFIATVLVVLFLANYFIKKQDFENNSNTRLKILTYISEDSIDDYIMENHDVIIYVSNSKDDSLEFEEGILEQLIIDNELENTILYMDSSKIKEAFLLNFIGNDITPNVVIIKNGEISNVLYTSLSEYKAADVISFINSYWDI